ncbi:MAG: energy transducer TonB [Gammaproteobacteria bacterium]|nr:energy transducer TonB [Gammaproteobacteria bacterium]
MDSTFNTGRSAGRTAILIGIVAFHVMLVVAINSSLSTVILDRLPPLIKAEIIEEIVKDEEPPPPPPTVETPPPYVPPPDIVIDLPTTTKGPTTALVVTDKPRPVAPPPSPVVKKAPEIDPRYKRRFQPDYPPTSRRLGEEGSVIVQVLVDPEGKVSDGKIQTSSGFPRLDEAALKHALRAWRFTPGTEDGKPVSVWHSVKVTFRIEG